MVKKEKKKKVISVITQIRTNKSFINLICVDKKLRKSQIFYPAALFLLEP